MSPSSQGRRAPRACERCLRHAWLLSALSGPLEFCARDRGRLLELLALPDLELLEAVAGTRRAQLRAHYERFEHVESVRDRATLAICRHDRHYPSALDGPAAPHMLEVLGPAERLAPLTAAPVVAILGTRTASDYGIAMARSLARGLAASGVSVAASLTDGISIAAHAGCLDARGAGIAVMGGGLGVACSARRHSLYERLLQNGCAVSELPWDCRGRRWGQLASERIVVGLATLTVVVEADETPADLAAARIAGRLGRGVAAVPGRVTSRLSRGTHGLLIDGASLVRDARDVLDLLYADGERLPHTDPGTEQPARARPPTGLEPRLQRTLERVGAGCDTPDKLARAYGDSEAVLLSLSELELMGLLVRGDGGRYVLRDPLTASESPADRRDRPRASQMGDLQRI
jgi:DNA processing protein